MQKAAPLIWTLGIKGNQTMSESDNTIHKKSKTPIVLGIICFIIYLAFIGSSFYWTDGWIVTLLHEHYFVFCGVAIRRIPLHISLLEH